LRQSAQRAEAPPSWKQEVNRRLAAHNGRKTAPAGQPEAAVHQLAAGSVAAKAAARVAARYAKAPSYSEMLADEARAAVRAAEAASRAALEAQAAAESVLAGLEAATEAPRAWEAEFFSSADREPQWDEPMAPIQPVERMQKAHAVPNPAPAKPAVAPSAAKQSFEIRWDEDMPVRDAQSATTQSSQRQDAEQAQPESLWERGESVDNPLESEGFEVVEAAQPIHANLIEFPRELVATRKLRPRRAESPFEAPADPYGQLSIFEVDPQSISTEPPPAVPMAEAGAETWVAPDWSGIELEEEPPPEIASPVAHAAAEVERPERVRALQPIDLASMNRRMLAAVVDFSLVTSAVLAAALAASANVSAVPTVRQLEIGTPMAFAFMGALYMVFFLALSKATPGMKYACLEFRTFSGERPARAERLLRLGALLLSILPLGLGVVWALFDKQHLCWHDRLSATYPRKP